MYLWSQNVDYHTHADVSVVLTDCLYIVVFLVAAFQIKKTKVFFSALCIRMQTLQSVDIRVYTLYFLVPIPTEDKQKYIIGL